LHSKNIVQNNLKSQNLYIKNEILKLGDFSISKVLANEEDMIHSKIGTPAYMSPEVCLNQPYDKKVDLWAMGIIIYELIALKKPFKA